VINVSLNDLMVGNELPAPRTAPRSEAPAFAALLDRSAATHDAAASDNPRDRAADARNDARATTWNTPDADRPNKLTAAERPLAQARDATRNTVEVSRAGATRSSPGMAGTDASEATPQSISTETDGTASAGAGNEPTAAANESDSGVTDQSAQTEGTNAVAVAFPIPAAPLPADIALLVAPGLVPQSFNSLATASQSSPILPEIQAAQDAPAAVAPKGMPVVPQLGDEGQALIPAAETTAGDMPTAAPAAAARTFSETLFAATMLAQSGAADTAIVLPASFKPQAATVTPSLTAAPPSAGQPVADELPLDGALTLNQPPKSLPTTPLAAQHGGLPTNQQTAQLSTLLDLQNVDIAITQAGEPISGKALPPLANGMVAQIGLLQPADKPVSLSAPTAPTFGAAESLSAGNTPTQTATAIIAPPVAQAVADEPHAKTVPDQDGMVLNAPAPTGAAHTSQNAAADSTSPAKFTLPTPPATDQVAVHIAKAAADGADKINIKLKPMSLGQIEVQLEVASDGRVHAVIAADKPETLDLLQRDARGLERALNDAGLRTDSGSLSFNLRGHNQQFGGMSGNAGSGNGFGSAADRAAPDMELLGNASRIGAYLNSRAAAGGVDIQV
jgi:hypothetical protein